MKNKVLVNLYVPEIDEQYSIYLPINKKIGNIILLLNKAISELSNGEFEISSNNILYNQITKQRYTAEQLLIDTDIRNGTYLILLK